MQNNLNQVVRQVHERIVSRSEKSHNQYLDRIKLARAKHSSLSQSNLAHACAACDQNEKQVLLQGQSPNIGIITAYNDMLSAHQPFEKFPDIIRAAAKQAGGFAQVAGGVPAMCDGVTQGQVGMELSLFSRDVIAQASAVALSHNTYSAVIFLGVCDKIVPGMMIAAAAFAHMPIIFAPAGPMPSGLPNQEKAKMRELFAAGKASREDLLAAEVASYHSPGTCTFYGTANTNQLMLEIMGLQLPGCSFVNPGTSLRERLTQEAVHTLCRHAKKRKQIGADMLSPASFVNAIVGVLASGGSTNHAIHLPAMAKVCGITINWDDFSDLSSVVPLLTRLYPNGQADVNHFHAAGGTGYLIKQLLSAGMLIEQVPTVAGMGLSTYTQEPFLNEEQQLQWRDGADTSLDQAVLRSSDDPFSTNGGLKLIKGNLGRAIIKTSALPDHIHKIRAPARIFTNQEEVMQQYHDGKLNCDMVCVVINQGPQANGMPELHKLSPLLANLQAQGFQVALVTDGRMSGASGKIPAAIHVSPEACKQGPLARLHDGDMICLDLQSGELNVELSDEQLAQRQVREDDLLSHASGCGRELFANMRSNATSAETGALSIFTDS